MLATPPLSLYVHLPWCVRKCPYCDFNSHETKELPEQQYVGRLLDDMAAEANRAMGRRLHSIFFGGGTPSLFAAESINTIICAARERFGFEPNIEITLEANPGTAEAARFAGYRRAGVNRLSLGAQSFSDNQLQLLGRIHSASQAVDAFNLARSVGFDNINIDLMHGLPAQSPLSAADDLERALTLAPEHISWYQLTIEPNTQFFSSPPVLPNDDLLCEIQDRGEQILSCAGYAHYEISAYSRPGRESSHNLNYWTFGDYLGIGAGAHGKLTDSAKGIVSRVWKRRQPVEYMNVAKSTLAGQRNLTPTDLLGEYLMNRLRLHSGFSAEEFQSATGLAEEQLSKRISPLVQRGLLEKSGSIIRTSPLGRRFLNDVLAELIDE
ncbi:MAG: putative oxygen-independent coproporphyrinogen III oxidase [Halieaceae bacterium]|jgi:putative oxygen-independent coproporphyrinogen III oxidase